MPPRPNRRKNKPVTRIYPQHFEEQLNFGVVRERLVALCNNEVSRHMASQLRFRHRYEEVSTQLDLLSEMMRVASVHGGMLPSMRFDDIRDQLLAIRPEGTYLSPEGVAIVGDLLEGNHLVRDFFVERKVTEGEAAAEEESQESLWPRLKEMSEKITPLPMIRRSVGNLLDDEGNIRDTASKELRAIRRELTELTGSLGRTMQSIFKTAQERGWVEQDAQPVLRDGRLLLPVTPFAKREVRGIVYDESSTGRTLFIEPEQMVETHNKIREKQSEEKREVVRLLKLFTNEVREHLEEIKENCTIMGALDFLQAKYRLAGEMRAVVPALNTRGRLEWFTARHPLLEEHLKAQGKPIVPLDVTLSSKDRILVISGPNAGGKSATLKTVGLLQYMLQCGLAIPIADHSSCCIFDKIFISLGDEQSLENDLSTYSSHLLNMKFFGKNANHRTLILIDEFGSGTEPIIGGAIAEALLDSFLKIGCFGMITTHYGNLKDYSETHEGVINGAMLFDRQKIEPLYQLSIGKPGSSFAIEIAKKIGLPSEILDYATNMVGTDYVMQDTYLQDIMRDKRYWEEKRRNVHKQEKDLQKLKEELEERLRHAKASRAEIITKAQQEAFDILQNANATIEKTIRDIKEAKAEKKRTIHVRKRVEQAKEGLQKQIERAKETPKPQTSKAKEAKSIKSAPLPTPAVGSAVRLEGSREVGEVMEIKGKKARVRLGSMVMQVPVEALTPTLSTATTITKSQPKTIEMQADARRAAFKPELDCRGMRVDELLQNIVYFIDDAVRYGFSPVRILHGTGTGALREATRQQLSTMPVVAHFHDERPDMGGAGITVVELNT